MNSPGLLTKRCPDCQIEKAITEFYRSRRQVLPYCKSCHNARCVVRHRQPLQRLTQAQAKRRWTLANPVRKRVHEGRSIFAHQPRAPRVLHELEDRLTILASVA